MGMKLSIGPGALVAAAFIGPGTVTACTKAGANFGFALLWALVFATIATIILQSMAARLGAGARLGLGEALMGGSGNPILKFLIGGLVIVALGIGNAAFESGNIAGGALGIEALLGKSDGLQKEYAVLVISALSASLILLGGYKVIEKLLIGLVILMAIAFAASALMVHPDFGAIAKGLVPSFPGGDKGIFIAIALIGTTVVPYNLFLHAAAARKRWAEDEKDAVEKAVGDTTFSVGMGGLISIFILSTAAASLFGQGVQINSGLDMAKAIEPTFGSLARYLIGTGLLAAGFTSAITAPLATGIALAEILGHREGRMYEIVFRSTALVILLIGTAVAISGIKPTDIITIAQVANGILLPIIAGSLLYAMNRKSLLGEYANGPIANILGGGVLIISIAIGSRPILNLFGLWPV